MDKLSVIIPTLNEATYLPGLLHALRSQTHPPDEIIVADAGSIDGTAGLARARGVMVVPGGRPGAGRNAGARAATGDIFLFLDADVQPGPDFIERALDEFTRAGWGVATCFMDTLDHRFVDQVILEASNLLMWAIKPVSPHAPGFCILVDSEIHRLVGGFDEALTLSEDHDFVRRASKHGKFGFLTGVRIPVSLRRIEKEGLGVLLLKYLWCEANILIHRPVRSLPFEYEFGAHPPSPANRKLSRTVRRLARRIRIALN